MVCTSRLDAEGRFAIVTNVGRDAVDVGCADRRAAQTRTAKSCGPGAPMQAPSWRKMMRRRRWQQAVHRGEHGISRKPLRREGWLSPPVPVVHAPRAIFPCAGAPGAAATRPSLRPLSFERVMDDAKLGRNAVARRWSHEDVIARSESDEAIQNFSAETVWIASLRSQ